MCHVTRTVLAHVTLFSLLAVQSCRSWLYFADGWRDVADCPTEINEYIMHSYKVPPAVPDRAIKTAPPDFHVTKSQIAGLGVYALTFIPRNKWLGEYEGTCIPHHLKEWQPTVDYMWAIYGGEAGWDLIFQRDAGDPRTSNWLRYINNARNMSELNVWPHWCQDKIFYRTTKDIAPYTELLTYYGPKAATAFGLDASVFPEFE